MAELILQGLTKRTHLEALREMFNPELERGILSVAFVSENGVDLIAPQLKASAEKMVIFAGIRNEISSAQALRRLLGLGVALYVVDTGSRRVLFHPKVYLLSNSASARLCIGSANLTLGGLNNNIEASVLLELDRAVDEDEIIISELIDTFDKLSESQPDNVFQIKDTAQIDELLAAGRIVDETALPPPNPGTSTNAGAADPAPKMTLLQKPLFGKPKAKAPANSVAQPTPGESAQPKLAQAASGLVFTPATVAPELDLVWESKPLSRRSLGIPTGPKSNPTGSTTLGSGTFEIDRVTYFRDDLFGHLDWTLNDPIETANQSFDLVIKGVLVGTFELTLRHSLTRAAAAAEDHNSPTQLSWNEARPLVARDDLLERTMRIWRSAGDHSQFRIEID